MRRFLRALERNDFAAACNQLASPSHSGLGGAASIVLVSRGPRAVRSGFGRTQHCTGALQVLVSVARPRLPRLLQALPGARQDSNDSTAIVYAGGTSCGLTASAGHWRLVQINPFIAATTVDVP